GGFLVVGSLSKTSVAMAAGAPRQLAHLFSAAPRLLTLLFLTPLFPNTPQPPPSALVIAGLLPPPQPLFLRGLFARSWLSFANAVIVIAAVLTLGVMQGIAVGIALSLVLLIHMTTHPEGAVLGQLPGTQAYRDVRRHPEAVTFPGLLIWRI